jgi:hypothetical protein
VKKIIGNTQIAGSLTSEDWKIFRANLKPGEAPDVWKKALDLYFDARLSSRYLGPIEILQENGTFQGDGFSIAAIQCSIVEFLESTVQGKSYRFVRKGDPPLRQHEYSSSKDVFMSFLLNRTPFKNDFKDEDTARDFYEGVRCGLLHEARTKNGWRIWAKHGGSRTIDARQKIVYRDNFQMGLQTFVKWYKGELPLNGALQEAFTRKFDSLCE